MSVINGLTDLLSRLNHVKRIHDDEYMASCPCSEAHAHGDIHQSLSVRFDVLSGKILLKCFTGCSIESICAALGCAVSDLTIKSDIQKQHDLAQYYGQQNGLILDDIYSYCYGPYQDGLAKIRYIDSTGKKTFRWISINGAAKSGYQFTRGSTPHRLYCQGDIHKETVILVEGEKDVNNLHSLLHETVVSAENGASANAGSGKWFDEYTDQLNGKTVIIIGDNDAVGKSFVIAEATALCVNSSVYVLDISSLWPDCPEKGDISDMIIALGTDKAKKIITDAILRTLATKAAWKPTMAKNQDSIKEQDPGDRIICVDYTHLELKETEYTFYPFFPRGELISVQGDTCSSKSTLLYAIGAIVTTGSDMLGIPCEDPGDVLFITNEDDEFAIKPAVEDAGGDMSRVHSLHFEDVLKIDLEDSGIIRIRELIEDYHARFVVLDPIQEFFGADMNKASETRPRMTKLKMIAREFNIPVVFVQHQNKDYTKKALHRGLGSIDFGAVSRSMLQVVIDPEDEASRIMFSLKNNTACFYDVQQGIRFHVEDHPGSFDPVTGKHHHFHGHAVLDEMLPKYTEKDYTRSLSKTANSSTQQSIDYATDPLVLTIRQLIVFNPSGLFIGSDDLITRITDHCGHCPYEQTQSKRTGLNNRVSAIRERMLKEDAIQIDLEKDPIPTKTYQWDGKLITPAKGKERGVHLMPVIRQTEF